MEAARGSRESPASRTKAALAAGCDAALLMNDRAAVLQVLDGWRPGDIPATRGLGRLRPGDPARGVEREYHEAATLLVEQSGSGCGSAAAAQ